MLAITLGYAESGRTAVPAVLYAGNDAGEAEAKSLNPPPGIIRTELIKAPVITRRRHFDKPAPEPVIEKPKASKAKSKEDDDS